MHDPAGDVELAAALRGGADRLGLTLSDAQTAQLIAFLRLIEKWNRASNLTAVREPLAMVSRHLLDSLAVLPWVTGGDCADVGSGAGLPGIVLAVAAPARRYVLIESNAKKSLFLEAVVAELGLEGVQVERARVQSYREAQGFATVISRAVAPAADLVQIAGHLCAPAGRLLAMTGTRASARLDALPAGWRVADVQPLAVPGLDAQRHIVVLQRGQPDAG